VAEPTESFATDRALIEKRFRVDLLFWISTEPRIANRILKLVEEVIRNPFHGQGKPEALKHNQQGLWARRITEEHRLTYYFVSKQICFAAARHHYR
jgi:toxin YoeB